MICGVPERIAIESKLALMFSQIFASATEELTHLPIHPDNAARLIDTTTKMRYGIIGNVFTKTRINEKAPRTRYLLVGCVTLSVYRCE